MKYLVLIIAMLLIASVMTFRTRSRSRAHARLTDCPAMEDLNTQIGAASDACGHFYNLIFTEGFEAAEAKYNNCVASEVGFATYAELEQEINDVSSTCPSRRR